MTKRAGMYKSEKRRKELSRLKKREEKRLKRLEKGEGKKEDADLITPTEEDKTTA